MELRSGQVSSVTLSTGTNSTVQSPETGHRISTVGNRRCRMRQPAAVSAFSATYHSRNFPSSNPSAATLNPLLSATLLRLPTMAIAILGLLLASLLLGASTAPAAVAKTKVLRFNQKSGKLKIVQVADMHYANGRKTGCLDVFPYQKSTCTDLNTTHFLHRLFRAEAPDLVVFTGDNIYAADSWNTPKSLDECFAAAVDMEIPWAAVLGNHDQESSLSREGVMRHIVGMPHTLSRFNPDGVEIDGFGNYNLEVRGAEGSLLADKSVLNLYFLDSGDYSTVESIPGYGWIKPSQQYWYQKTSMALRMKYMADPPAPGLAFFHIPLQEYGRFSASNRTGVKQEPISSASINSGFFTTLVETGDVKAVFVGHDHLNDFCGILKGIQLCYAGGFGYHAYGKAGWPRRARVISATLEKLDNGKWGEVMSIETWKRLDDEHLSTIDTQILWSKYYTGNRRKGHLEK